MCVISEVYTIKIRTQPIFLHGLVKPEVCQCQY